MKAAVRAESYDFSSQSTMSTDGSQVGVALSLSYLHIFLKIELGTLIRGLLCHRASKWKISDTCVLTNCAFVINSNSQESQ
jgi:hypothetical protein